MAKYNIDDPLYCPVCGHKVLPFDICDNCNFENSGHGKEEEFSGANNMTLTEAKEAYKKGHKIY